MHLKRSIAVGLCLAALAAILTLVQAAEQGQVPCSKPCQAKTEGKPCPGPCPQGASQPCNKPCCQKLAAAGSSAMPDAGAMPAPEPVVMPKPDTKIPIGTEFAFVYSFDKKPSMGNVIVKVELFDKNGQKITSLDVKGDLDMPSMRGMHSLGDRPFVLNKKGDYLLPIGIVMPGEWELTLTFVSQNKILYKGAYRFKV